MSSADGLLVALSAGRLPAIQMAKDFINVFTENDLTQLLRLWRTPRTPRTLDRRIRRSLLGIGDYQLGLASPRITRNHTEVSMKRCNACAEEFADKFSFCPVDGTPLNQLAAALIGQRPIDGTEFLDEEVSLGQYAGSERREFQVTMIGSAGLPRRLATEISFVIERAQRAWPEFKRDPIGASKRGSIALAAHCRQLVLAPNALAGGLTAVLALVFAVLAVFFLGRSHPEVTFANDIDQPVVEIIKLKPPDESATPEGTGVGVDGKGRVGLASGKGEGSAPDSQRARGGGGSGNHDPLPPSTGAVPQSSAIAAPINPPLPNPALAVAGIDIDPLLWKSTPSATYGDPRSQSTVVSQGPGDGGVIGTGKGLGVGEGNDNGFGPGNKGNMGDGDKAPGSGGPGKGNGNDPRDVDRIFNSRDVTQRARVISKPEAGYTEEARK